MTRKKKIIIIVAVVLAVAAWLLWRKKSSVPTVVADAPQPSRLDQLIEGAGLTSLEADLVRRFNPTGTYKEWIINQALQNGIDYESSCLLNCLWNHYHNSNDTSLWQSDVFKNRYQTIYAKVLAMN